MFDLIWSKSLYWSRDRTWEMQIYKDPTTWLNFDIDIKFTGSDHAGPRFCLGILGRHFEMSWPHRLHWDYDNGHWQRDTQEKIPPKF